MVVRAANASGPFARAPEGLRVRFLTYPQAGRPSAQRNHGWRATNAPLVVFTDDDCRPAAHWAESFLAHYGEEAILQGRTEPDPDEIHLLWGHARSMEVTEGSQWYETCNIAYPRARLAEFGGFDERFPHAWGEDTDLGLRAVQAGMSVKFIDEALVWHCVHPRPLHKVLKEATRRNKLPLLASHPIGRDGLYLRFFLRRSHPPLLLALAGLTQLRRHPVRGLAMTAPYLAMARADGPLSLRMLIRAAWGLPGRFIIDLVELGATIRAAIVHRFPAL